MNIYKQIFKKKLTQEPEVYKFFKFWRLIQTLVSKFLNFIYYRQGQKNMCCKTVICTYIILCMYV